MDRLDVSEVLGDIGCKSVVADLTAMHALEIFACYGRDGLDTAALALRLGPLITGLTYKEVSGLTEDAASAVEALCDALAMDAISKSISDADALITPYTIRPLTLGTLAESGQYGAEAKIFLVGKAIGVDPEDVKDFPAATFMALYQAVQAKKGGPKTAGILAVLAKARQQAAASQSS